MPLVKCETCSKDVADAAEVCPHCGQDQPEKYLRQHPTECLVCPECSVNNYGGADCCRYCEKSLYEARKAKETYLERQSSKRWSIIMPFAVPFVLFGVLGAGVSYLTGKLTLKESLAGSAGWFVIGWIISGVWNLVIIPGLVTLIEWSDKKKDKQI